MVRDKGWDFKVGNQVWVKPGNARCTTRWKKGQVTDINSINNVSVDGMPRHVLDIRHIVNDDEETSDDERASDGEESEEYLEAQEELIEVPRRSGRVRRPPLYLQDYVTD